MKDNIFDFNRELEKMVSSCRQYISTGKVASYIPELAKANPDKLGVYIVAKDGEIFAGDYAEEFTVQSIIKPIILLLAMQDVGMEEVRKLVGVEATGKPFDTFNYTDQALKNEHINPMVNAGAIAMCTLVKGKNYKEKFDRLLELTQKLSKNPSLTLDEAVYLSEKRTGNKNRALAYMLNAYGMIREDVEELVDFYFRACSIKVSAKDLAHIAFLLADRNPCSIISNKEAKCVNAIMMTSGMYDGSGEFALNVGIPAKSGVGGGIMATVPGRMGIGVYSPALDSKGNSVAGRKLLELLSEKMDLSVF